jgi:hypothetical protein
MYGTPRFAMPRELVITRLCYQFLVCSNTMGRALLSQIATSDPEMDHMVHVGVGEFRGRNIVRVYEPEQGTHGDWFTVAQKLAAHMSMRLGGEWEALP